MAPFKSASQRRLFEMIAHGKKPSSGKGPSKKVAQKFIADSRESGNPAVDEYTTPKKSKRVKGPIFGKAPLASASHHPRAGGKHKAR